MKLLTWNCSDDLDQAVHFVEDMKADLLVIQNCPPFSKNTTRRLQSRVCDFVWSGGIRGNGIGVVVKRPGLSIQRAPIRCEFDESLLPLVVDGRWPLLAVWAGHKSGVGLLWRFLQDHAAFLRNPCAMVVGDLNSNRRTDMWRGWLNHQALVEKLHDLGLRSAYHEIFAEGQGDETAATSYRNKNMHEGSHTHYAFAGTGWNVEDFRIGDPGRWLGYSDHMPIAITLRPGSRTLASESDLDVATHSDG